MSKQMLQSMYTMYDEQTLSKTFIRFCHHCGAQLDAHSDHVMRCSACGHTRYTNVATTVGVVLRDEEGRILFTVRGCDPFVGCLDTPGGFMMVGETAEEAACREIKEELGVDIKDLTYLCSLPEMYLYSGWSIPLIGILFEAKMVDPHATIVSQDDVVDVVRYKLEDIPMDQIGFPSLGVLIEKLRGNAP